MNSVNKIKTMVPLTEAKWIVKIEINLIHGGFYWRIICDDYEKMKLSLYSSMISEGHRSIEDAVKDFKEFAELNNYKNYLIQEPDYRAKCRNKN